MNIEFLFSILITLFFLSQTNSIRIGEVKSLTEPVINSYVELERLEVDNPEEKYYKCILETIQYDWKYSDCQNYYTRTSSTESWEYMDDEKECLLYRFCIKMKGTTGTSGTSGTSATTGSTGTTGTTFSPSCGGGCLEPLTISSSLSFSSLPNTQSEQYFNLILSVNRTVNNNNQCYLEYLSFSLPQELKPIQIVSDCLDDYSYQEIKTSSTSCYPTLDMLNEQSTILDSQTIQLNIKGRCQQSTHFTISLFYSQTQPVIFKKKPISFYDENYCLFCNTILASLDPSYTTGTTGSTGSTGSTGTTGTTYLDSSFCLSSPDSESCLSYVSVQSSVDEDSGFWVLRYDLSIPSSVSSSCKLPSFFFPKDSQISPNLISGDCLSSWREEIILLSDIDCLSSYPSSSTSVYVSVIHIYFTSDCKLNERSIDIYYQQSQPVIFVTSSISTTTTTSSSSTSSILPMVVLDSNSICLSCSSVLVPIRDPNSPIPTVDECIQSTFVKSTDDWLLYGDYRNILPNVVVSSASSSIEGIDGEVGGLFYFQAPSKFYSHNLFSLYNSVLSFSMRISPLDENSVEKLFSSSNSKSHQHPYYPIQIQPFSTNSFSNKYLTDQPVLSIISQNSTSRMVLNYFLDSSLFPTSAWKSYFVVMSEEFEKDRWKIGESNKQPDQQTFRDIVSKVSEILIRGEFIYGYDHALLTNVTLCPPGQPPGEVQNLNSPEGLSTQKYIQVFWDAPLDSGSASISLYQVQVSKKNNKKYEDAGDYPPDLTFLTIGGLKADTKYYVRIRAVNIFGPGPWSETLTRTQPKN